MATKKSSHGPASKKGSKKSVAYVILPEKGGKKSGGSKKGGAKKGGAKKPVANVIYHK